MAELQQRVDAQSEKVDVAVYQDLKQQTDGLLEDNRVLSDALGKLQLEIKKSPAKEQVIALEEDLQSKENALSQAQTELETKQAELIKKQAEITRLQEQIDGLREKNDQLDNEKGSLESHCETLKNVNGQIAQRLSKLIGDVKFVLEDD